jgi:hypothetical protein
MAEIEGEDRRAARRARQGRRQVKPDVLKRYSNIRMRRGLAVVSVATAPARAAT